MKKLFSILLAVTLMFSIVLPANEAAASTKQLEVHFIDVGQGDATLIKATNGKTMLIDGCPSSSGKKLVAYLKAKGVKKLDYVVATHPDADHIGGLVNVVNSFKIGTFLNSGKSHTSATYKKLLTLVDQKNITYKVPALLQKFTLDKNETVQVLHVNAKAKDNNDASLVLRLVDNKQTFLFMGDVGTDIENKLISKYQMKANVLKVGHHGSDTSSSAKFISKVKPNTAILSYGKSNSYGHPHSAVTKRLANVKAKSYNTVKHCNIIVKSTGSKHTVTSDCKTGATTTTTKAASTPSKTTTTTTKTNFQNCTELRKVYPKGVAKDHPAYQAKMDRDNDGMACELN